MGFTGSYLISLLLYISVINEIRWPTVTCQDDEPSSGCLPKKTFLALLRIPEVSSNLAAYSRTARIIQDAKNHDDLANWKSVNQDDAEDGEICLPAAVYLELFRNPAMRGHLSAIARAQKILENPATSYQDSDIKRSLAILAKNNDMPVTGQGQEGEDEGQNDGEGGGDFMDSEESEFDHQTLDMLLKILHDNDHRNVHAIAREYTLPNGQIDFEAIARDYGHEKRNVASMARDFNLPQGKRSLASLARDYALPGGKRNFSSFLTDPLLAYEKRNIASLMRNYGGKRNVASLARDFALPPMPAGRGGKRATFWSWGLPYEERENDEKRNIAALSKNDAWPTFNKRFGVDKSRILRFPTQNRFGRSLDQDVSQEPLNLQRLAQLNSEGNHENAMMDALGLLVTKNRSNEKMLSGGKRPKRQIDFSDEYPLPVMQNNNVFDYEELIEALTGQYPKTEKRFMGADPVLEVQDDDTRTVYVDMPQPTKRHIGALARLGWLPSFRSARFSRSPRYLVTRSNSADGTTSNNPINSAPWALKSRLGSQTRYLQSLYGGCRHGMKRFPLLPIVDNFHRHKFPIAPNYIYN